ncbi:MAG: hypothetical protein EOM14_00695 [Clostridia bacterium]|nr:hypothetical protein [Clostridia bacterium]
MTLLSYIKPLKRAIFFVFSAVLICSVAGCTPASEIHGHSEPPEVTDNTVTDTDVSESPTPDSDAYNGPDVPEQPEASDDFFSDSAFMGNSLMDGFRMFSGLTTCDYYAATSMTVVGATTNYCIVLDNGAQGTLVDGLCQKPYGKIYILLGINEIGCEPSNFGQIYGEMLDTIIAAQPDCDIYVMGLTPVSYAKSTSSDIFTMERVNLYNEQLYNISKDKQCYYLDLVSALAGEDGYLPAEETPDGVHFSTALYQKWLTYVKTHYIPREA